MRAPHAFKFTVLLFGVLLWHVGDAQYIVAASASQFFDVGSGGKVDVPWRFANDSLLAIVKPPAASAPQTNSYVFMTRKRAAPEYAVSADEAAIRLSKRQWGAMALPPMAAPMYSPQQRFYSAYAPTSAASIAYCPASCIPCSYAQCRGYQTRCSSTAVNCCCPTVAQYKYDLKDSCDGEEAVAGCINGLCGQGYVCTALRFCCKCASGRSIGNCVNGMCPQGFICNDNNQCCSSNGVNGAVSAGTILGQCVNDRCPVGFVCESDNYCHAVVPFSGTNNNVTLFTPGAGPVILGKCVNDRCPVGYTCGVGNLCYSNTRIDGQLPNTPYVLGRCDHGLCPLGYSCGTDDFCYSNVLPVTRIGGRPEVLGRCDAGLCPTGYTCGRDDFCHRNSEILPRSRPVRKNHARRDVDDTTDDDENDSSDDYEEDNMTVDGAEDVSDVALRRRRAGKNKHRGGTKNVRKVSHRERHGHKSQHSGRETGRKSRYGNEDHENDDGNEDFAHTNRISRREYRTVLNDAEAVKEQIPMEAVANVITVV